MGGGVGGGGGVSRGERSCPMHRTYASTIGGTQIGLPVVSLACDVSVRACVCVRACARVFVCVCVCARVLVSCMLVCVCMHFIMVCIQYRFAS